MLSVEPTVFTGLSMDLQSDGAALFSLLLDGSVHAGLDKVLSLIQDGAEAVGAVGSTLVSCALRHTLPEGPLAPDPTGETLLLFAFSPARLGDELLFFLSSITIFPITALAFSFAFSFSFSKSCVFAQSPTRSRTLSLAAVAPAGTLGIVLSGVGVLTLAVLTDIVEVYDEVFLLAGTGLLGLLLDSKNLFLASWFFCTLYTGLRDSVGVLGIKEVFTFAVSGARDVFGAGMS